MKRNWVVGSGIVLAACLVGVTLLMDHYRGSTIPVWNGVEAAADSTVQTAATGGSAQAGLAPQSDPVPLQTITVPPQQTVAFIDGTEYSTDFSYDVTFVPYGTGQTPHSLVVMISASTPQGTIGAPFEFTGRNVVLDTSRLSEDKAITQGGIYKGTLTLIRQDNGLAPEGVLALMLVDVSAGD